MFLALILTNTQTTWRTSNLTGATDGLIVQKVEFLDEIQTKFFLLAIHTQSPLQLCPRFLFLQNHATIYTFLETDPQPLTYFYSSMVYEIHSQTTSLRALKIMPRNLKDIVCSWIWPLLFPRGCGRNYTYNCGVWPTWSFHLQASNRRRIPMRE